MKSSPKIVEWTDTPQMDTGAPCPAIALREDGLYVAYSVAQREDEYAIVRFGGVLQHVFGYPNDEALGQHPLYEAGLKFYAFNAVIDSPHVRELAERNERAFAGSRVRFLERRHWVVTFHDETLEVVGMSIEFLGVARAESAAAAIEARVVQQALPGHVRNARA